MDSFGKITSLPKQEAKIYLEDMPEQGNVDGIPYHAKNPNDCIDPRDLDTSVVGHCECFDLTLEQERATYADLLSKLHCGDNLELYFEERITTNEKLMVYITYFEYIKIAK